MKHTHLSLSVFLAAGLFFGACKKQLNVYPTTSLVDGNLITDQVSAQQVLNGVYYRFVASTGTSTTWYYLQEEDPSVLAGAIQVFAIASFYNHVLKPPTDDPGIWSYGYNLVEAANGFVENMTPVTSVGAGVKQRMLAEARFMRAFANAELLLYFGQYYDPASSYGIILRERSANVDDITLPRTGVAAAYTSILADLDAAIGGLPALNTNIYSVNAGTAKLLKARVLMNRGAAGDYAQVISLTKDIISTGPFVLEDSLKDIFLTKGFNSKEVMLGIQPYSGETRKYTAYVGSRNAITGYLPDLLADDARNQWMYKIVPNGSSKDYRLSKYYSGDFVAPKQTPLSSNCYAFRLSEAYLLEAEAMTMSGGDLAGAKALLKTVMSHAGAGVSEVAAVDGAVTAEALQLEIIKENLRNFAYENGVDWFALRRLPLGTLQTINPRIKNKDQLLLPIPVGELTLNKVVQNPGY
ncbi:MAG: RagB/SusD family nutrient uptake outer membrane protein [Bacteroidetes bacterium]|nr:RagB/SusD family nutrient uptake outer membrane protein [Bacteroidota bacterium]